jgi:arylsulfatase
MKAKKTILFLLPVALAAVAALFYIFLGPRKKPNIVLITVDALRADYLGAYGFAKDTSPRIDALAAESIIFNNAYCTVPKTSASFATILTGLHPFFHKTSPIKDFLDEEHLTIAEFLRSNDYETAAIVENANLSRVMGFDQGFASYKEVWNHVDGKAAATPFITAAAREFLRAGHRRPYFLWVHYIDTHAPYVPPDEFVRYNAADRGRDISRIEKKIISGSKKEKEAIRGGLTDENYFKALYEGCVRYVDAEIGKILDELKARGDGDTVVILTADHGEELGERNHFFDHGPLTFQSSTRVPLIVRIPGRRPERIDRPVSMMDIFPTVAGDILRRKLPVPVQGISLFANDPARKLFIFGQFSHAIITGNRSFIDIKPNFAARLGIPTRYCFDIHEDPREERNLIADHLPQFLQNNNIYLKYITEHRYPVGKKQRRQLSEKDLESMKTLGYIN